MNLGCDALGDTELKFVDHTESYGYYTAPIGSYVPPIHETLSRATICVYRSDISL